MQSEKNSRNRNDQQEEMFPCEINKMARIGTLRTVEMIEGLMEDSKVFRVDFLSENPPRVFGSSAILFEKSMTPFDFTDTLRKMADKIDNFLHRGQDD